VLDVNLGHETAEPIAERLRARGTPFVVLTGYSTDQLPSGFHGAPVLSKPTFPAILLDALQQLSMPRVP
jgi:CheY-like chemotaxis protein